MDPIMGPVEYLNATREQIPLTPLEAKRTNSQSKFLPFYSSSSADECQLVSEEHSLSQLEGGEFLLDLNISKLLAP